MLKNSTWINIAAIVFEIDLEYPKEIQELHNNYPSAPDKIEIKWKMISE